MTATPSIDGLKVIDLLHALSSARVTPRALCRTAAVDHATLHEPGTRVPIAAVVRIFDEAERRSGDRLIGLHAGLRTNPRGVMSYLILSSPRLRDALRYIERFSPLVIDGVSIHLEVRGSTAALIFDRDGRTLGNHRHLVHYLLVATMRTLRRAVGAGLRPSAVHIQHADPSDLDALSVAFGCPVRSGERDSRLVLPAGDLEAVSRMANPLITAQLEKFAAGLSAQLADSTAMRGRVTDAIRALMAGGSRADRIQVARELRLSHRSIQRRLQAEGTTFKAARDEVLHEVVAALLTNPALKVETVGLSVGFSDGAAFSRAFKRWSGRSPRQHRAALS